jgi:ABC-type nitrate/sulfonate/bicarbonate transport system substrate-binding protein
VIGVGLSTFFAVEAAAAGSFKFFQPCVEDSTHTVSYLLVPKESRLKDAADLKGKKVGTYSGASQVLVLRLLLKKLGLDPDDPSSVLTGDVASNLQVDALAAGQFDAFLMLEPYATTAMMLRGARPLLASPRIKYILDPFPAGANGVSTKFMSKHPNRTHKVVAALERAIELIHSNEDAAKAILPKYDTTMTPEMAAKAGIYRWWKQADTDIGIIQKYADLFYEGKVLKKRVDVESMILK